MNKSKPSEKSDIELSFIFPCLNEKDTIDICLTELENILNKLPVTSEIIVSDNGSTDGSLEIAKKHNVRIIHTPIKGYGEALKNGFSHALGKYIAFADIDGSYPLKFIPQLYEVAKETDADMVIASRTTGIMEKGAMPFLHRYLGTPVLTKLINILFRGHLTDCNSGFRIMKKSSYDEWGTHSAGMEFASELIIKALKAKAKIIEIPAGLNKDKRHKPPHLSTWKDGMRHLLFILSEAPKFFEFIGLTAFILFSILQFISFFLAPLQIGNINILNYHSQIIFIILSSLGIQIWGFSMLLYLFEKKIKPYKISQMMINIPEEKLFILLIAVLGLVAWCIASIFISWAKVNFQELNLLYPLLFYVWVVATLCSGLFSILSIHILKRIFRQKN